MCIRDSGYIDSVLIEGKDYRGIDTALISRFNIIDSKLHYIKFSGEFEGRDTRPILDATLEINGEKLKIYNVHFPSGFHDVSMRIDSLDVLSGLLNRHNYPTIALGDFNVNTKEDNKLNIYKSQEVSGVLLIFMHAMIVKALIITTMAKHGSFWILYFCLKAEEFHTSKTQ